VKRRFSGSEQWTVMTQGAQPGDDDLLREHLAAHDDPCPKCRYNLRGVFAPVCPECGSRLRLSTALEAPPLPGSASRVGRALVVFGLAVLGVFAAVQIMRASAHNPFVIFIVGVAVLLGALWFWQRRRSWVEQRPRYQQVGMVTATGALVMLMVVWFLGSLH
jgi:hypothetical protein